jgi:hypothetical protein
MEDIVEWTELIHREDRSGAMQMLEDAEKALGQYDIRYRIKTKSGNYSTIMTVVSFWPIEWEKHTGC